MKRTTTKLNYAARIERVVSYIADHLDDPLDLDRLAAIACFSPFHFHRIHRLVLGETADQTVRRLRLHRASAALGRDGARLSTVAREAGYGSVEAFSRAFSAAYGYPPSAYRAKRRLPLPRPNTPEFDAMYDVTIKAFEGAHLSGLPHRGDYNAIGATFDRLFAWAGPRGLIGPTTRCIGVYYDDPAAVPVNERRAFAGLTTSRDFAASGDIQLVTIPAGRVASLVHKGPYTELEDAYRYLYGAWLPSSGEDPADQPVFEEYLNNPRELPPREWLTEVFLPLAPAPSP